LNHEFTPYSTDLQDQVRDFADLVAQADGVEAFGEQTLFNLATTDPTHLVITRQGAVVGYAQIDHHSAELAVHPSHRRNGIGGALLDAVKSRDPHAAVWAHGDLPPAQALAKSRGLAVTRELLYMRADLTSRPVPSPPQGIGVEVFQPDDDAADWLALNAEVFADHPEQGRLTQSDLDDRMSQDWFDPHVFWLARESSGALLGYMWVKYPPGGDTAEIYVLGVSPQAQGRGVGKFLTEYAMAHMHTRGAQAMDLYVEGDNAPALATYRAYGSAPAGTHVQYT